MGLRDWSDLETWLHGVDRALQEWENVKGEAAGQEEAANA